MKSAAAAERHAKDPLPGCFTGRIGRAGKRTGGARWWRGVALVLLLPGCLESRQEEGGYPILGEPVAGLTEELRIDGYAEDLVPITYIAVNAEGTIAMIQRQDRLIRFFSASGEPLGTFGRRGEGPGEFAMPDRLGWHGDTLWVFDGALRRASFISPSLELARIESDLPRSARLGEQGGARPGGTFHAAPLAFGPKGEVYAIITPLGQTPPEPFTESAALGYLDSRGVIQEVILPLERDPSTGPVFSNDPESFIAPPVGRAAVATASLEGRDAGTISLVTVDLEGDTIFTRRYSFQGEEIPAHVADSLLARYARRRTAATGQRWTEGEEVPPMYPPLRNLRIGEDGSFWIRTRPRERQTPYHVLAPDGDPMGTVFLPEGSFVAAAMLDRIWVLDRDSLGVESVVRYGVEWN